MRLSSWAITYRGHRSENEDAVLIPARPAPDDGAVISSVVELGTDGVLCALADGVGSRPGGGWAARTALNAMEQRGCPGNEAAALGESVRYAQDRVHLGGVKHGKPATTVAGLSCSLDRVLIFNVGDSRVYQLAGATAHMMSVDHLSRTDGRSIARFLGGHAAQANPHIIVVEAPLALCYLICSDGLYGYVRPADLLLPIEVDPTTALSALVNLAMDNGSQDNISAIFSRFDL